MTASSPRSTPADAKPLPSAALDTATLAAIDALADDLRHARRVLVITGAGMSADSGLPTYRGTGGLYDSGPTEDGVTIEQALSGPMLRRDPALCWKYLGEIERGSRGRRPHDGHAALAALASHFERLTVLTQNVDGFHGMAGQPEVIEMHGNLHELFCEGCPYETWVDDYTGLALPPVCPRCAAPVRPRVVLFGEALPVGALQRFQQVLDDGVDAVISIGTTSVFPYIAAPVVHAARAGRPTAEINPDESRISPVVRHRIRERAALVLVALLAQLQRSR